MDFMTIGGLLGGGAVLCWGIQHGAALTAFVNPHGLLIVIGGTFFAVMINCSSREMRAALRAAASLFVSQKNLPPDEAIAIITGLCRRARQGGPRAIQDAGREVRDDGFTARAIDICLTLSDAALARQAMERDINKIRARHMETGNVFRTMGLLAPMFGLLGTLIGIIAVLRSLSDASQAGPAMAVAISSAFYGILLANMICVPMANKLRSRSIAEGQSKEVVMEGILAVLFSQRAPVAIETELAGFVQSRQREARAGSGPTLPQTGV